MRLYELNRQERHVTKLLRKRMLADAILRTVTFLALAMAGLVLDERNDLCTAIMVSLVSLSCFVVCVSMCMKSKKRLEHTQRMLETIRKQKAEKLYT